MTQAKLQYSNYSFKARIEIIDINPYVELPASILTSLLSDLGKTQGPIPVRGIINGAPYVQTVVKFRGLWRLYINGPMLKKSGTAVGYKVNISITFDPVPRVVPMPAALSLLFKSRPELREAFMQLSTYRQKELKRYIGRLKNEETIRINVDKIERYLEGKTVEGVLFRV